MSRRPPNPGADRAAQNQQTIKGLLKLEGNKTCADCKRNKHPRWASWNLGIFVCIRCSGIHRGMGTHISRVKSVDLDAWTDEQLQSVLRWGNARANKYWEAKLAPGHVPSEAKIENFIRTKYESKRWVMDGPMPDPATLEVDGDDDIPLNIVKEKQSLERSTSQRVNQPRPAPPPQDLIGDTARPTTTSPAPKPAPRPEPKQSKPADSLLGLDFFGTGSASPSRPASTSTPTGAPAQSRPDLKQSILSLYASAPKPQPVQHQHSASGSISGMPSPPAPGQGFGGLNDAFSSLSFGASPPPAPSQQKPSAFAGLGDLSSARSSSSHSSRPSFGGGFFDSKPVQKSTPAPPVQTSPPAAPNFAAFNAAPAQTSSASSFGDLFDLSAPAAAVSPPPPKQTITSPQPASSVFNLTSPAPAPAPAPAAATTSTWASNDWGANAWTTPDPEPAARSPVLTKPAPAQASAGDFGWGSAPPQQPQVSADEDFGGWSSAAPVASTSTSKPATGFSGGDDLFSNVWGD